MIFLKRICLPIIRDLNDHTHVSLGSQTGLCYVKVIRISVRGLDEWRPFNFLGHSAFIFFKRLFLSICKNLNDHIDVSLRSWMGQRYLDITISSVQGFEECRPLNFPSSFHENLFSLLYLRNCINVCENTHVFLKPLKR